MARAGLYKSEVKKARESLLAQGRHPSVDAVRIELGNTGSKSTIHKYLKELEMEDGEITDRKTSISEALHDLVARLAVQLEVEANERIGEAQKQIAAKELQLNTSISALHAANEALSSKLTTSETKTQDEVAAHAKTTELLQREIITRHTLEQQVTDLKERLLENEAHRQSLEAKHTHARDALEHYRESVKEQRDQDIRRHDLQVQQLQGEIRQLQQSLVRKQNEITALNQDGARLVAELSQAQKLLYEIQRVEQQHAFEIGELRKVHSSIALSESNSKAQDATILNLKQQLMDSSEENRTLLDRVQLLQLELAKSTATVETQQLILERFDERLSESLGKSILKSNVE